MTNFTEITKHDLRVGDTVRAKSHGRRTGTLDVMGTVHAISWNANQTQACATVRLECPARLTESAAEGVSEVKRFSLRRTGRWCLVGAGDFSVTALHYPPRHRA